MRYAGWIFATLMVSATPAQAQNDQVLRGPPPAWVTPSELLAVPDNASGLVFMRRADSLIHLDEQGQANYLGYRARLLHSNALQLGNLAVSWNPSAGNATIHAVRVHRDGATIDVLESAQFEILRREDQLEQARLDGNLTAVLRVPDLRVGDELEFAVTIRVKDPTLGLNESGLLLLAPAPPPGRFRLGLSWGEGHEPTVRTSADLNSAVRRSGQALTVNFDNPPILSAPNEAPLRYSWQRLLEYSDFADWQAISRQFAPMFARAAALSPTSPLQAEISRISAAHTRPIDRASAALKLVQQEVRYIYVGLDGGNYLPATAEETWQRRYGDCKGKTALLLALLAGLGIEAEAVLVNNQGADDGLDTRLPMPGAFDHVLVRVRIDGTTYWLDGTLPPVASPTTAPVIPYRWVLPLSVRGSAMESLAWRPAEVPDELSLHEIDARTGFDQPARVTHTTIMRGLPGLLQQQQFSALTPAQLLAAFRQQVGNVWQTIEDVQWRYDAAALASVLTIVGTMTVDWSEESFGAKSLTLPGGGFNPPERRGRPADQDQAAPYANTPSFNCHVTTVRIPTATRADNWSYNSSFSTRIFGRTFSRAFELRDGAIRMVRGSRIEQREIEAATAQADNARIAAFDNSTAQITYQPARTQAHTSGGRRVPATYEIDWTGRDVPCLGSAAAG